MSWKIPLFKIYWDEKDIDAVSKVIKRGTYWANGPEIEKFEKEIANFLDRKYAVSFNSGTSALHVLLLSYDVKDQEVIVPSFTFIATANAILLAGGIPVFAETESETFGLDYKDVKEKINEKTKAIINLDYGGFPAKDSEKLKNLAEEKNIIFIEDAAESLGAHIKGKKVGNFGHSSIFSFCQNKVLTTGEGGMIVTDSKEIYEKAKFLRSHGRVELSEDYFSSIHDNDYIEAGYNLRMPSICAALGLSQFKKIDKIIKLRREIAHYLSGGLSKIKEIRIPLELDNHFQVYQMYTIILENKETRDKLMTYLAENNIMSKIYFNPVHLKTIYKEKCSCSNGDLPKTEELSNRVLNIPLYPSMTKEEKDYLINKIYYFFENGKSKQTLSK